MASTKTTTARLTHKVRYVKPESIHPYSYIVGSSDNLAMVKKQVERNNIFTVFETEHGLLMLENNADVKVKDGEIYEAGAGAYIVHFFEDVVAIRATENADIEAVFNDVLVTVRKNDTLESVLTKYDENRESIRSGHTKSYKG